jgi:hypothetical protein
VVISNRPTVAPVTSIGVLRVKTGEASSVSSSNTTFAAASRTRASVQAGPKVEKTSRVGVADHEITERHGDGCRGRDKHADHADEGPERDRFHLRQSAVGRLPVARKATRPAGDPRNATKRSASGFFLAGNTK